MAQTPDAIVAQVTGTAYAERNGTRHKLAPGDSLFASDTLITDASSGLEVHFADDSIINLGAASRVEISEFIYTPEDTAFAVKITEGMMRSISGKIVERNPESFSINSPLASLGIRGTTTIHKVSALGETHAVVSIGANHIVVVTGSNGQSIVLNSASQGVEIPTAGPMHQVTLPDMSMEILVRNLLEAENPRQMAQVLQHAVEQAETPLNAVQKALVVQVTETLAQGDTLELVTTVEVEDAAQSGSVVDNVAATVTQAVNIIFAAVAATPAVAAPLPGADVSPPTRPVPPSTPTDPIPGPDEPGPEEPGPEEPSPEEPGPEEPGPEEPGPEEPGPEEPGPEEPGPEEPGPDEPGPEEPGPEEPGPEEPGPDEPGPEEPGPEEPDPDGPVEGPVDVTITDPNGVKVNGSNKADYIQGGSGNDIIHAYGGDDEIHGGGGDDAIYYTSGNDKLYGDGGNDTFHLTPGDMPETPYQITINGGDGDDTISLRGDGVLLGQGSLGLTGPEGALFGNVNFSNVEKIAVEEGHTLYTDSAAGAQWTVDDSGLHIGSDSNLTFSGEGTVSGLTGLNFAGDAATEYTVVEGTSGTFSGNGLTLEFADNSMVSANRDTLTENTLNFSGSDDTLTLTSASLGNITLSGNKQSFTNFTTVNMGGGDDAFHFNSTGSGSGIPDIPELNLHFNGGEGDDTFHLGANASSGHINYDTLNLDGGVGSDTLVFMEGNTGKNFVRLEGDNGLTYGTNTDSASIGSVTNFEVLQGNAGTTYEISEAYLESLTGLQSWTIKDLNQGGDGQKHLLLHELDLNGGMDNEGEWLWTAEIVNQNGGTGTLKISGMHKDADAPVLEINIADCTIGDGQTAADVFNQIAGSYLP